MTRRKGVQVKRYPSSANVSGQRARMRNRTRCAVKFSPPYGEVSLALRREEASAIITVTNTGPIIPAEQLALVFERFYQVDESDTTIQPGTGIGLSFVRQLVEL